MKPVLSTIILCFTILLFTSCSKEEINDQDSLLGTYEITSFKVASDIDLNNNGIAKSEFDPGCLNDSELTITSETSGTLFLSSDVAYNTITENGKMRFAKICAFNQDLDILNLTYQTVDGNVIFSYDEIEYPATIDGNTISLTIPNGFVTTDIDTFETTFEMDLVYVFTKR